MIDKACIVRTLATGLSDSLLEELFPEVTPATVRNVLLGKQNTAEAEPFQQELFTSHPAGTSRCSLYTDGASRGNPGEAGAGAVLLDDNNREIAARSLYLGTCTNNIAEYRALLMGLETAIELGCKRLAIFLDSQLIVRQVQGKYKVKNEGLRPLFNKVQSLLAEIDDWRIDHVPRNRNRRADELANQGIDEK